MAYSKLSLSQLEQYLSKAAWILKGPVDTSDFKLYALDKGFSKLPDLSAVDWNVVLDRNWKITQTDWNRRARIQAVFLVLSHVPSNCFERIVRGSY